MPAPKKNNYWSQRRKHGRDLSATPEFFQEMSDEYHEWLLDNPIIVSEKVVVGGKLKTIFHEKIQIPTMKGYLSYIQISRQTWNNFLKREDFFDPLTAIEYQIEHNQQSYAAAGVSKEMIVTRIQGLNEKTEHEVDITTHENLLKNRPAYKKPDK